MFFGIDPGYIFFVFLPSLIIGGLASMIVKGTFNKYARVGTRSGLTGAQAAAEMLRRAGIYDVEIRQVGGFLSDHYNPMTRSLALSPGVYGSQSISAIGVACHEAGHAIQHAKGFSPLYARSALVPMTNFCTTFYWWFIIIGILINFKVLAILGLIMCGMGLIFALITLPVEWDASRRAKNAMLEQGFLTRDENSAAASVLNAAFLTYVAAVVTVLITVLFWAMRLGLLGGRDD